MNKNLITAKAAKKPTFLRQESYKKRLANVWRKPKGLHAKLGKRGNRAGVRSGHGTPAALRGLTKDGLLPIRVTTVSELADLDKAKHAVVIGNVGGKQRVAIIEKATEQGFTLHNASSNTAKQLKERFDKRKAEKAKQKKAKEERDKKLEERLEKEEKKAEKKETLEDKTAQEKKESGTKTTPKVTEKPEEKTTKKEEKSPEVTDKPEKPEKKVEKKPETKETPKAEKKSPAKKTPKLGKKQSEKTD